MAMHYMEIVYSKMRAQQKNYMLYMYLLDLLKFRPLMNVCDVPLLQAQSLVRAFKAYSEHSKLNI